MNSYAQHLFGHLHFWLVTVYLFFGPLRTSYIILAFFFASLVYDVANQQQFGVCIVFTLLMFTSSCSVGYSLISVWTILDIGELSDRSRLLPLLFRVINYRSTEIRFDSNMFYTFGSTVSQDTPLIFKMFTSPRHF